MSVNIKENDSLKRSSEIHSKIKTKQLTNFAKFRYVTVCNFQTKSITCHSSTGMFFFLLPPWPKSPLYDSSSLCERNHLGKTDAYVIYAHTCINVKI